jgi:iron-sulfur cluster repair protein YtfE (RIC family)
MAVAGRSATCDCAEDCAVAGSCSPSRELCLHMKRVYVRKIRLCDELEAIADSLPLNVDRLRCLNVASQLLPALRQSHRNEEEVLFPAFERGGTDVQIGLSVQRLKAEHIYDEGAAEQITDALMWIGRGGDIANPEALGFMLRAFFDTVRRHIAFEREHVFPTLGKTLGAGDA